jgi:hypothetical protein
MIFFTSPPISFLCFPFQQPKGAIRSWAAGSGDCGGSVLSRQTCALPLVEVAVAATAAWRRRPSLDGSGVLCARHVATSDRPCHDACFGHCVPCTRHIGADCAFQSLTGEADLLA